MKIPILENIEAKIRRFQGGCWVWKGDIFKGSTPDFRFKGKRVKVREFLYGLHNGIFPPKKVYRTCLNCLCVNPLHMSLTEDIRSVIAKLYDDEAHDGPAYQDPITGEINGGFVKPKKTIGNVIDEGPQFFEGNGFGQFIQAGKEAKYGKMERSKKRNEKGMA